MTREPSGARARLLALAQSEEALALAEAALWIAAEAYPGLDVPAYLRRLEALGLAACERVTPAMDADACAIGLNRLLFEEAGLRGNAEDYYDPRNSFLNEVLDRRLGIPITLSVVYMAVAARAGVTVRGIGLPGHFLVRLERRGAARLLDPFHGGAVLGEADCEARLRQLHGDAARLEPAHLVPVTTRQILARMLANLKGIYMQRHAWGQALAAVERILLLTPGNAAELRDLGAIRTALAAQN